MTSNHTIAGLLLLSATIIYFGAKYFRARKEGPFRAWGWAGLGIIALAELLLLRRTIWVAWYFTPLVWTGYLLVMDATVSSLRGKSRLKSSPGDFLVLAFWSVPFWLIFEAYNLRLENWSYVGLPAGSGLRGVGYVWSFATIWPAMYETADFIRALGIGREPAKRRIIFTGSGRAILFALGLLMLTLPVLLPVSVGRYLFGAVWLGFILLLDPVSYRWNGRSLLRDWETGRTATFYSFLIAGLVCGILWEFWNYWAGAKWLYVFPIWQGAKVFEMPLLGYLGFPPFALECFVMYEFLGAVRNRPAGWERGSAWRQVGVGADPDLG